MMKDASMNIRSLALILSIFTVTTGNVLAQEAISQEAPKAKPVPIATTSVRSFSLGLTGAYGIMLNGVSTFTLPSVPTCCPGYTGRVVYQASSTTFVTDEPTTLRSGNQTIETAFRHTLKTTASFVMIEPMLDYRFAGGLSLFAGARLGTSMSGTYDQKETFADPSLPYDYTGGVAVRNASSGDLPNMSGLQAGLVFGARYRLPMNAAGSLSLVPEVSFSPMFTDVVTDASWTISPIRIGLSILMDVMKEVHEATPLSP
ncbi:MAG: hypothetical protein NTX15_04755 [Candidatus Kapabacteria bacterium]|nr:hypothetical protein [Candidatus Kapabacteria bacterium]